MKFTLRIIVVLLMFSACKEDKKENKTVIEPVIEVKKAQQDLDTLQLVSWRSGIAWRGFALGKSHTGKIAIDSGYIALDKDKRVKAGRFYIDMTSINVVDLKGEKKAQLEAHLKGTAKGKEDHFFNVTKYPKAIFNVFDSYTDNDKKQQLEGDLTLKGIDKSVEPFPFMITEADGKLTLDAANFKIDRTDWGITYASKSVFDDLKDTAIDDDFVVNVKAVFAK